MEEVRSAVKELVEKLNNRPMKQLKRSRRDLRRKAPRAKAEVSRRYAQRTVPPR
jgi:hypothetical protein